MQKNCSLSLFLDLDVAVGIIARKVVFCRYFILCAVATFWAMSLVRIYPGRASKMQLVSPGFDRLFRHFGGCFNFYKMSESRGG